MLKPSPLSAFLDSSAKPQSIWGLALPDRLWFSHCQQRAAVILNDRDLNDAGTFGKPFECLTSTCLEMSGLNAVSLDSASKFRLLFECQERQGAIAQLNGIAQQTPIAHPLESRRLHQQQVKQRLERGNRLFTQGIIQALDGSLQRVAGLALCDRDYCLHLVESISDGRSLQSYDTDPCFRAVVDECLLLNGISPYWVDLPMLERLLVGTETGRSLLVEWNFPPLKSEAESQPLDADTDPMLSNLDSLWSFTESLEQALAISSVEPWAVLQPLLKVNSDRVAAMYDKDGKPLPPKARKKKADSKPDAWFLELMETGELDGLTQLAREKDGAAN